MAGNDSPPKDKIAPKHVLSASAMVFVPQPSRLMAASSDADMVRIIDNILNGLKNCPEDFFHSAASITRELTSFIIDERRFVAVIEHLVNRCIHEDNFQYNGARLCSHLSTHLMVEHNGKHFRSHLLTRCKVEFNNREELLKTTEGQRTLSGYTMFLAELMGTLLVHGKIIDLLPGKVINLLATLVSSCTDEIMQCIYRVLKLSGAILDEHARGAMDDLFTQFESVTLTANQRRKISILKDLRAVSWIVEDPKLSGTVPNPYANAPMPIPVGAEAYPSEAVYYEEDQFGEEDTSYFPVSSNFYEGDQAYHDQGNQYPGYESNGYPGRSACFQGDQVYNDQVHGYEDSHGNHFLPEEESWQAGPDNYHIVYNGDVPYVIEDDSDPEMNQEMLEAFEQFILDKETKDSSNNVEKTK